MKKSVFSLVLFLLLQSVCAQRPYSTKLLSHTNETVVIEVTLNGFGRKEVETPNGIAVVITNDDMASMSEVGQPDIPTLSIPLIINDKSKMEVNVLRGEYVDYQDVEIAPFKGHYPRSVNPNDIPYFYGDVYEKDEFFPQSQVDLDDPYILRDFRAQNLKVTPFAYNPQTKVLRVFNKMFVEIKNTDTDDDRNVIERKSHVIKLDKEFKYIYEDRFINYNEYSSKYDVVEEEGDLLIICHDDFIAAMQPFVEWKKSIGRDVMMVGTSETGISEDDIKLYISDCYNNNPDLVHVLLVGDTPHIPGKYMPAGYYSGCSDWWYGQLSGDDFYNELIIGRFCVETIDDVSIHVNKVIHYERYIDDEDTWLTIGQGVSKRENMNGHNGEDDYEHIDIIREDLLDYNYTMVHRDYLNVSGVSSSAAIVSQHINEGVSIINYCNHGSPTSWGVFSYDNDNVNALTNDNKLPFIISVACNNGQYDYHRDLCFAETWMRAKNNNNGNPTGAVGGMFSYISQPWIPPMYGQDEMIDILTESYSQNVKRTMGGVALNGNMKILDIGGNMSEYCATYNTWNLFGDPTLTLRNAVPTSMNVTHNPDILINSTSLIVNAVNSEGARASLTRNGEIMGTALVESGTATITFEAPLTAGQATLTVFAYNKITYVTTLNIIDENMEPMSVMVNANPPVINTDSSSVLSANVSGGSGVFSYSWSPSTGLDDPNKQSPTATPTQTTTYICNVSDGYSSVSASATIIVMLPPTDIVLSLDDDDVSMSWNECDYADGYNIYRDNYLIASNIEATSYVDMDLAAGMYAYTIRSVYDGVESIDSEQNTITIGEISVNVYPNPGMIAEGATSSLTAYVYGATDDVTYSWSPTEGLNNPNVYNPLASPTETTTYTVTVSCGSQSASASAMLKIVNIPDGLIATKDGNNVVLEWNPVEYAEYYIVMRNGQVQSSYEATTSYIDDNLDDGNYCYTIKSVNDAIVTLDSEEACVEIDECVPPQNITAQYCWSNGEFGALIDFDRIESSLTLTEYRIYRSNDNVDYELVGTLPYEPEMNHYQYSDMSNISGTHYYRVSAYYAVTDCESEFGLAANSSDDFVPVDITSIGENSNEHVKIYPNPAKDKLNVKVEQMISLSIINIMGQTIYTQEVNSDETIVELENLESGLYLLSIETKNGIITRQFSVLE